MTEESEVQFKCLGENTRKYINSSVRLEKQLENVKKITSKMKLINSTRFMASSTEIRKDCKSCLEYTRVKDKLSISKGLKCNKNHKKYFKKDLVKTFCKHI